jgi:nucleoside-diphosphate-sugar epimerase
LTIDSAERVALVAGGTGIVGHAVAAELKWQRWTVRTLARRSINGMDAIPVDLADREAAVSALRSAANTTHLFYAALSQDPDLAVEAERNSSMLGNVLDGLKAAGVPLQRVITYEGFKIYDIHLGAKVRTPARESDPPHMPPNIYLSQQAELKSCTATSAWDNVALRPDVVVGDTFGNPMNIALVVGVFAELSRELGIPMRFPGTEKAYRQLVQFTDAGLLVRASVWAATDNRASGQAFNITNGDVFRWERMWEDVARHLGMDTAPPIPLTLTRHMRDKGPVWSALAARHSLVQPNLDKLVGWAFGDFIFHTESDVISDVNKIHEFGFAERMNSTKSLIVAIDSLKQQRILP